MKFNKFLSCLTATFVSGFFSSALAADLWWDGTDSTGDADGGAGTWDTSSANWDDAASGGNSVIFANGDNVTFGGSSGAVTIGASGMTAGTVTLGTGGYTFTANNNMTWGSLAGTGNFTKAGSGRVTIAGSSTYSGTLAVSAGTLSLAGGTVGGVQISSGSGRIEVASGTLTAGAIGTGGGNGSYFTIANGATVNATTWSSSWGHTLTVDGSLNLSGNMNFTTGTNTPIRGSGNIVVGGNFQSSNYARMLFEQTGTTTVNGSFQAATWSTVTITSGTLSVDGAFLISTATVNIQGGTINMFGQLRTSEGSNAQSIINHSAGTLNVLGANNTNSTSASMLLGHWAGSSTYNLSGGVLNVPSARLSLGWDGTARFIQTAGTANLAGINFNNGRNNAATYQLTGGRLNVGSLGMSGNASSKWLELNGGTLGAYADWTGDQQILVAADSVVDTLDSVDGSTARTITLNGAISGAGGINKVGSGVLVLKGTSKTYTGVTTISGGSVRFEGGGSSRGSSSYNVLPGATMEISGTNIFVGGHGVALAESRVITVDGGTLLMTSAADTRIGNVTLRNGATWTSNRGLGNYDVLVSDVDTGGGTVPATIAVRGSGVSTMNGSGGIHLRGMQSFDVENTTANADVDLDVSMILDNGGSRGGSGAIQKLGAGTMRLTADNTYSGSTHVSAGTLIVDGTHTGGGLVLVDAAATLGGSGSVADVNVSDNGILSPGNNGVGHFEVEDLTLALDSVLAFELGAPALTPDPGTDFVNIRNTLTLGGKLHLSAVSGFGTPVAGDRWLIMSFAGGIDDTTPMTISSAPALSPGLSYGLDYSDWANLYVTVVPEAGSGMLAALGLFLILRRRLCA